MKPGTSCSQSLTTEKRQTLPKGPKQKGQHWLQPSMLQERFFDIVSSSFQCPAYKSTFQITRCRADLNKNKKLIQRCVSGVVYQQLNVKFLTMYHSAQGISENFKNCYQVFSANFLYSFSEILIDVKQRYGRYNTGKSKVNVHVQDRIH